MIIREACVSDAPTVAALRNETWQSAYRGVIADEYLDAMSLEDARARFTIGIASPEERFFVAVDGGEVIGFSACGIRRECASLFQGELCAIYVRPCHQRSGAGRLLFRAAAARLLATGFRSLLVWTLSDNRSNGFYERMSGCRTVRRKYAIGGIEYDMVAYEWDDITYVTSGM